MESRNRGRLLVPMLLVLAAGQAASVWAQEAPPPATPAPEPAVAAAPTPAPEKADAPAEAVRLRFTFKDAPYDQVLDFLARETGLPVIKEADLPATPVTFISAADYSVAESLEVLNRMLFMHGLQVRRESNFLLLTRLEDLKALGEKFVGEIPPGVGDTQFVTVVVPLLNATAEQLADRLKVLSGKHGAIAALPQQNALVVVDTAAQCRRIRELVEQLDQDPPSDSQVKLFPLRHAQAEAVYNALKGLVAEKRSTILVDEKGKRTAVNDEDFAGLNLQPDPRTNSIIAVGPLARLATVEELIALLDRPEGGALEDREVMTFALAAISADEAAKTVTSLFAQSPAEKKPTVLPLASQGKLTVLGSPAQLAQIAAVLGQADPGVDMAAGEGGATPAAAPETRSAVVRLTHVTPAAAQSILDRLLSPRQKAVLRYTASPDNKGLIVSGPVGDVDRFAQILSGIDAPMELDREVRQVRIAGGDPAAVLAKATELYQLRSAAKTDPVSATLDADARTVTIVGTPKALGAFAELLRSAEANATIDRETRVFDLARVRPSDAAPRILRLARPLLEPADGSAYVAPQVEAADELGQVIVRAAPDQFAVIERLVKSVDEAGPADRAFRVIRATAAGMRAAELRDKAVQIYAAQAASAPGAGAVDVTVDEAANAMLVVADAESMRRFTAIVDELQRQAGPSRDLRMLELRNAKAADVVAFLNQMLESSRPFSAHTGPDPVFEAIEATNSILAAAQPSQFAVIEQLVRSLDSQQTAERPPLRILRLRTTDAANVAQVLSSTYSQRPAEQRARLPVDIQADAATNTLIVSAHPDVFPEIERVVTELNETTGVDAQGREIRIFPLKVAQAEELARTIDQMYPEPPMPIDPRTRQPRPDLRPPREIVVRADRLTNSLIVDAPVNRLAGFEQLVKQLDQQKLPENVELRTYRVERAQLDAVANTLRSLAATNSLTRGVPAAGGVGTAISISTEPMSRTLIVSGPTQIFPQVEKVLAELDSPPERPETGLRMYALQHARAERLQPLLDRLLTARLREQQDQQGRPVADVQSLLDVASDGATNSLIISAPESIQQIAAELVKALDTPAAEAGRPVIRVVPLTFAEATQTATTLNAALPTMELPSGGRVTIMAIAGSNALLLSGAEADLGKVEELVTTLDVRPMTEGAVGVQTFALKHADAAAIAQTVQRLLVEQQETDPRILSLMIRANRGQIPRPPQVRVEPDVRTNSLVISAPASTLELAEAIIERLDQPAEKSGRSASTFTPAKADPRRLVAAAKPILDATLPVGRRPVELAAEPASGSVIVIGTDEQVAQAVKVLAELDDRAVAVPQVDLQIIDVQHADAAAIARTVQAMLADRSRWPEPLLAAERAGLGVPTPTVNADAKANRLVVSAPAELMSIATELVSTLDRPAAQGTVEVRVFSLSKSEATSVAAALRTGLAAGAAPSEPAPLVTPEPGSNSVVVAAAPDRLKQAEAIVKELDTSTKPDGVAVRTVTLRHARAETVAPIVETLLSRESVLDQIAPWQKLEYLRTQKSDAPPIRVAAEPRLNAVVVTGPAGIIEIAEQVIAELDVEPDDDGSGGGGGRSVRVLALSHADAAEVAANIQAVFDDKSTGEVPPTVRVDRGSNSLILRATDAQLRTIESLVGDIDAATLTTSRDLRLIPIDRSRADAQVMAETLQRLLQQRGNVRVEVISAEDLLKPRPQAPAAPEAAAPGSDTPDRRSGDARPLQPGPTGLHPGWNAGGLHAALTSLSLATLPDDPPAAPAPASEPAEAPVTIAVDPATNSLIVLGSSRMAQRVATLAAELERQMPAEPGRIRIITLPENADARAMAQVVSSTVRQIGQRSATNPGGFTGRVAVDADPAGGALIVSANDTDFEPLGELIGAIARPAPSASLTVKIYPLSNITSARAIRAVGDLLSADPRSRQARRLRTLDITLEGPGGESDRATIDPDAVRVTADPGGASLIVAAPADALPLLDRFIAMIDQAPVADRMAIRRYELANAKGADIARTLQSTFDAARQGLGAAAADIPRANFSSDARTNSLLVTATEAQLREVETLLKALDAPLVDDGTEVAIIPLQVARPTSVKQVVETVLAGRDPAKRDRITITATDDSSLFVIRAEPGQIAQAREIVAEMDKAETAGLPVRSIKLQRADAESIARALQQFFEDRARAQSRPGQRPRTRQVAVVGDRRTSTLVVSASDEDFRQIESLVETFDAPAAARDLQFRIIPLQHARTTEIRTAVQNIVAELIYPPGFWWGVGRGQQEQQDTLVVEFNDRSNSVILMGQGEQFATVERLVQSLDLPASERAALAVRAVRLKHADPRTVASAIQGAMTSPDWPRWRGPDPDGVRAETDQRSRTVFLIGRAERIEQAAAYAEQFDAAAAQPDTAMESVPLRFARADQVASNLQRFFQERARAEGETSRISALGSRDGNVVIVSAPEDEMALVKQMLASMDQPEEGEGRTRRLFQLRNADAREIAQALREQFPRSQAAREGMVIVTPQTTTNSVIVSAPEEIFEKVEALVGQLDSPPSAEDSRIVTVTLSSARADDVASSLRQALPKNVKVAVTPVRRSNSLLLTGSDEAIQIVMEQIAKLDQEPTRSPVEFRRIKLESADAYQLSSTIREMLRARPAAPGEPTPAVSYSTKDNTLLVSAAADQIDDLQKMIDELDVPATLTRTTEFVPLKFADATATALALDVFYGRNAPEASTPGARNVTIIANPLSRSLVISAEADQWPGIRSLLEKLDNDQYDTSRRLEIVPLRHADAVSLAATLTEAFVAPLRAELDRQRTRSQQQPRRGDGSPDVPTVLVPPEETVTVVAERLTNALVISAVPQTMERLRGVVEQLDVPEFARLPEARVIPLRSGDATDIAAALRQMFTDTGPGPSRQTGLRSVLIAGDDKSRTLIVRADDAQFAQIKALADTLQQEGDRALASVRVLRLGNIPAGRLVPTLRTTFTPVAQQAGETLAVEIDRASNAVVIASSERLFEQIRKVAEELDAAAPLAAGDAARPDAVNGLGQSIFIIDVENNSPEQVRQQLEQMGLTRPAPADRPGVVSEPVTIVPLTSRRALAVVANPADGQAVVALVRSLDAAPASAEQHAIIVRLRTAQAAAVAQAMEALIKPRPADALTTPAASLVEQVRRLNIQRDGVDQADLALDLSKPVRILPEPQTNSVLIVSAKPNCEALAELVRVMDRLPIGDAVTVRFFPLDNASAQRTANVIKDLFAQGDRLRQTPATNIRGEPQTEVGKALAGQIAVAVDERTNALVVAGREEAVALVEILVRQLDGDGAASWIEPSVIPLKHADATRLAETLRKVLVDNVPSSPEAAALQRQVARIRVLQQGKDPADPASRIEADAFAPLSSLVILPEASLNALIVLGSNANTAAVAELVRMLDVPAAAADNTVRVYPLRFAAADRVAAMLREIFRQQVQTNAIRPEDDLVISADARTNALIVSTSPRSFLIFEKLLATLDGSPLTPTVGMHIVPVPGGNVADLAPKIERLMRDRIESATRAGAVRSASDTFSVTPEPATGSLLVVASDENLQMVRDLVAALSTGAESLAASEVVDVVPVSSAGRAEDLLPALRELYIDKENARRGSDAVRVTPSGRVNALVVRGTPADVQAIRDLVQRLESTPVTNVTEIKRIELRRADAVEAVRLLQSVLAGRPIAGARPAGSRQAQILRFIHDSQAGEIQGRTGRPATEAEISGAIQEQVTLTAEQRTNSVVVVAPARLMILIEELISDLDTTVAGARSVEIFRLKNADARAMAEVLRDLFNLNQQGDTFVLVPDRQLQQGDAPAPDLAAPTSLYPVNDVRQQLAITIDPRTNSLLVSATAEYLEEVRKVVLDLDAVEANEREQLIYTLRNTKAVEVAATMRDYFKSEADTVRQTLGADRAGSLLRLLEREVTVQGDEKSNRLIVGVSPRYRESIDKIVKELDATPPQVLIQVLLAEVTLDSSRNWGVDVSVGPFGGDDYRIASLAAGAGVSAQLGVPNIALSSADFELLIRALEVQGRLEVLSRPQILVKNNTPASIEVGEDIGIVTGVERLFDGNTRSEVERRKIGIILNVTPSISDDGFLSLVVEPEISNLSSRTTQISEDFQAPVIDIRTITTQISVRDGETILIGGLFQTRDDERKSKIPLLGDIPLVGGVFRSEQVSQVKTELLVILTPRVIRSGNDEAREAIRRLTEEELGRMSQPDRIRTALPVRDLDPPADLPVPLRSPYALPPEEDPAPTPAPVPTNDPQGGSPSPVSLRPS